LSEIDLSEIHVSLLLMRRYEKDFILRNKDKYVKRMEKEAENFTHQVELSTLSEEDKKLLLEYLSEYLVEFELYVEKTRQLNTDISLYRAVTGEVAPILEEALRLSGESVIEAKDYVKQLGFWLSVCMVLLLVLVGSI